MSDSRVPEPSRAAVGLVKHFALAPFNLFVACYDHLGYAFAIGYCEWLVREVYKYHTHLATVVGIYRTR